MRHRAPTLGLAWAVCCFAATGLSAQQPPPAEPAKGPAALFAEARDLIKDGRYDAAAERLKAFLAANPTDQDFQAITRNEPTAFLQLRKVAVWSEEPNANREDLKVVEEIIRRSEEANKKLSTDPARINKFVRNLGASLEERVYAEQQLKLSGPAAVPVMVEVLRTSNDINQRAGILSAVGKLGIETVPGFLAALDGLPDDLRLGILTALADRSDLLALLNASETDFTPALWYFAAAPGDEAAALRAYSRRLLSQLTGGRSDRLRPEAELTRHAEPFIRHTARYRDPDHLTLWTWDPARQNVVAAPVTREQADDYYAVRDLRWALDRTPNYTPAQDAFLAHGVERAVGRVRLGDLAQADPTLYQILAAVPAGQLVALLDQALTDQRTALALGLTQVLAARADPTAARSPAPGKPSAFARGLDYPDARVQLAAAVGLLRAPVPPEHGRAARIVEILRRAAAVDPPQPGKEKEMGRALIADPSDARAERVAGLLREKGYSTERFATGRDLLRRVHRSADADLYVIDRHIASPELIDVLAQLRPDASAARRPVLVVASSDKPRPVPLEHMLLRLALLVAATESSSLDVPPPFFFDPRRTIADEAAERAQVRALRDRRLQELFRQRLDRLTRLVEAANLPPSRELQFRLDLRLPQVTYAALAAEFPITLDSAPLTHKQFQALTTEIGSQPRIVRTTIGIPTTPLGRIIDQLDLVINPERIDPYDPRYKDSLNPRLKRYVELSRNVDPDALLLPADTSRDIVLEDHLARLVRPYPGVTVIPEPFTYVHFAAEVDQATVDPTSRPRDPAEKRQAAKLAIEWLRRMAVGEVPGYDVRPAEPALRQALRDDELAPAAIEAVGRIPTAEAQQDLLVVAVNATRPQPIRIKAAEEAIRHTQAYGKLTPANQIDVLSKAAEAEVNNELRAKLLVAYQLLAGKTEDLGKLIAKYPTPVPQPPKEPAAGAEPPKKQEDTPKKPDEPKM